MGRAPHRRVTILEVFRVAVFVVQHVHVFPNGQEDVKFIGVYSTRELAEAAAERLRTQPGFAEAPDRFHINEYDLDRDHWTEGYVSV